MAPEFLEPGCDLRDVHGRTVRDLRISLTTRCNYQCTYCRAEADLQPQVEIPAGDCFRLARIFHQMGVCKIRLTGGEPLMRPDIVNIVRNLAALRVHAPLELACTTNGHFLAELAQPLRNAGLDRVNVSLDALSAQAFSDITGGGMLGKVLDGIKAARDAGLNPVKINCVVIRGVNDNQIIPLASFARTEGVVVRFLEFMPVDAGQKWSPETVVTAEEILRILLSRFELKPLPTMEHGETAMRFTFAESKGELGIIAPVSHRFCADCTRVRVTADRCVRSCLFDERELNLALMLDAGVSDMSIKAAIIGYLWDKQPRHNMLARVSRRRSMRQIGG